MLFFGVLKMINLSRYQRNAVELTVTLEHPEHFSSTMTVTLSPGQAARGKSPCEGLISLITLSNNPNNPNNPDNPHNTNNVDNPLNQVKQQVEKVNVKASLLLPPNLIVVLAALMISYYYELESYGVKCLG
jgi:hypothetical protein